MYSLPLQSWRWFSSKLVSDLTERIHSICKSLIIHFIWRRQLLICKIWGKVKLVVLQEICKCRIYQDRKSYHLQKPAHFYCLSFNTTFLSLSLLHHYYHISIVFPLPPPTSHFYCLPAPPPLPHFCCFTSSTTTTPLTTFLLSFLYHNHYHISIVFPPSLPLPQPPLPPP